MSNHVFDIFARGVASPRDVNIAKFGPRGHSTSFQPVKRNYKKLLTL